MLDLTSPARAASFAAVPPASQEGLQPDAKRPAKPRSGSEERQRQHVRASRFDDAELAKLEERASASGLTVGAYLRACALETAGVRARRRAPVDRELLARTNADLNRVGNNVNQIAHALNSGREPPAFMAHAMQDLQSVLAAIRRALGYDSQG